MHYFTDDYSKEENTILDCWTSIPFLSFIHIRHLGFENFYFFSMPLLRKPTKISMLSFPQILPCNLCSCLPHRCFTSARYGVLHPMDYLLRASSVMTHEADFPNTMETRITSTVASLAPTLSMVWRNGRRWLESFIWEPCLSVNTGTRDKSSQWVFHSETWGSHVRNVSYWYIRFICQFKVLEVVGW